LSAREILRTRTDHVHGRVETGLGLSGESLTRARLLSVGQRLDSFWAGTEPSVDHWFATNVDWSGRLQWVRRRRGSAWMSDSTFPKRQNAPAVFATVGIADVLGWLYVREGSTLGGAVIEAHANTTLGRSRLRSFAPYDEGPQPMWRAYLAILEEWSGADATRAELVASAALKTFGALEDWLLPVFVQTVGSPRSD
jgi:heme oxygenase